MNRDRDEMRAQLAALRARLNTPPPPMETRTDPAPERPEFTDDSLLQLDEKQPWTALRILGCATFFICLASAALAPAFGKTGWSAWMFLFVTVLMIAHRTRWEEIWRPGIGLVGKLIFLFGWYGFLLLDVVLKMRGH